MTLCLGQERLNSRLAQKSQGEREREREREIELEPCSEIRERERLNWGLAQKSQLRLTWNDDELNQDE